MKSAKKYINIISTPLLATIFATVVLYGTQAYSEGADTGQGSIEDDEDTFSMSYTLPVELVEEQSAPYGRKQILEKTSRAALEEPKIQVDEAEKQIEIINNESLAKQASNQFEGSQQSTTLLNVKDADITALVKTFSKLTGRNYIIDSNVKGKVTIHLPTAVTYEEALRIFDSVLLMKGFTTIPVEQNTWKVVPAKSAKQTTVPIFGEDGRVPSDQLVTQFIRLKHVSAGEMQTLLSQYISPDGTINAFTGSNSLIIIDSDANIARLRKMVSILDVPAINQELTVIPILYADVGDIAEKINTLIGNDDSSSTSSSRSNSNTSSRRQSSSSRRTSSSRNTSSANTTTGSRVLPIKVIPDERTNSLIILADPESTARITTLVKKLDSEVDLGGGRFFVYRLKHADSEEISEIVTNLISGASEEENTTQRSTSGSSISRASSRNQTTGSATNRLVDALRRRRQQSQSTQEGAGRVNFEGEVSVAADTSTNSLIINASKNDYLKIKQLLDELDVKRPQVMVEATILEVSLNKEEGFGVEWQSSGGSDNGGVFAQSNYGGLTEIIENPGGLSDLTIAAASTGTVTLPGGLVLPSQALLIRAVSAHSNVNVLSSPTIVTTDNEEAEIIVGENVPFVTSTSTDTSNINNTFNSIERQDVGITLRITPQISSGKFVNLKIFVEISNVVNSTRNDPNGPTTTVRTTETTVDVKSGQMVVTGGLISDNVTEATRGVPVLEDIPVLGYLFKREDSIQRRTNLLIFITPKILQDQFDAREETREKRDTLSTALIEQDFYDQRQEVLFDRNIDRVTESVPVPEPLPSTIRPAIGKHKSAKPRKNGVQSKVPLSGKKNVKRMPKAGDVIEVTVRPPLKNSSSTSSLPPVSGAAASVPTAGVPTAGVDTASAPTASESAADMPVSGKPGVIRDPVTQPRGSIKPRARMSDPVEDTKEANTFLVLRPVGLQSPVEQLPGHLYSVDNHGTMGVKLYSESIDEFSVGKKYSLEIDNELVNFVCLGAFEDLNKASVIHPKLAEPRWWNKLSKRNLKTN